MLAALLIIIFHVTKCRFVCQRTDRSGAERLAGTENNLCVFMRFTLIITGEVQVDIRLFVSLKAKERLKRNIKSGFFQRLAAIRADGIRHVASGASDVLFDAR